MDEMTKALIASAYDDAAKRALEWFNDGWMGHKHRLVEAGLHGWVIRGTPTDARAAFEQAVQEAERRGQIKAGGIFSDTNPEAQYVADGKIACPCCLGSGHKDDGDPNLARIVREAVEVERERVARLAATVCANITKNSRAVGYDEGWDDALDIAEQHILAIRAPQETSE